MALAKCGRRALGGTASVRPFHFTVLAGRKSAREKITSFLLDLADRLSSDDRVDLPMQRVAISA